MIDIQDKGKCSGCGACLNICPQNSIIMKMDEEGFMYPKVKLSDCIDCGLCNKVCPIENNFKRNIAAICDFYCAHNKDKTVVRDSSSGGIFGLLAERTVKNNGVVYGVELKKDFIVEHGRADNLEDCLKFRKSKYLQSNIKDNYRKAEHDLKMGKEVLFSGTPCQIAGLYSYLMKDYENLITCDVVCHGVPSKLVFDKYISELNREMEDKAISIIWRDKRQGWRPNRVSILFEGGKELISTSQENPFQKGFLDNLYLRPCCYKCQFAQLPRLGDISLADFWGYQGSLLQENVNEGLSIVIISSDKGKKVFEEIKDKCSIDAVTADYVKERSRHSYLPPIYNNKRKKFFKDLNNYNFMYELNKKYICLSLFERKFIKFKNKLKTIMKLI